MTTPPLDPGKGDEYLTVDEAEYIAYQETNAAILNWIKRKLRLL